MRDSAYDAFSSYSGLARLVRRSIAAARKAGPDLQWGACSTNAPNLIRLRAHQCMLDEVAAFLMKLTRAVKAAGHNLEPHPSGVAVRIDGEVVPFLVNHTIRRARHVETQPEKDRHARWSRDRNRLRDWVVAPPPPSTPLWDFEPTDQITVEIGGLRQWPGVTRRFQGAAKRPLEARLDDILASFAACALAMSSARSAEQVRAAEIETARQLREEVGRLREAEGSRREYLAFKLLEHSEAVAIQKLAEFLEANRGHSAEFDCLLEWVRERSDSAWKALTPDAITSEVAGIAAFSASALRSKALRS